MVDRNGPLPPLLLTFTIVTGMVDAVSYLALGHVFVANMTGNIIFLGLAAAGVPGVSAPTSLVSIAAFLFAGAAGGRIFRAHTHRGHLVAACAATEFALLAACTVIAAISNAEPAHYALIVLLALAMGLQNSVARALAVPDMTTTVLTMTLTGLASDSRLAGGASVNRGRRLLAVGTMLCGALIGGLLMLKVAVAAALAAAAVLLAATWVIALLRSRREPDAPWTAMTPAR